MFLANMWWLAYVTIPGMIALQLYLGLYWAFAALIIRGKGWVSSKYFQSATGVSWILGFSAVWCALEWLRGIVITGLPWMFLGHTQSPWLVMCQVADALGVYGISFWVAAVNALVFLLIVNNGRVRSLAPIATVAALLGITLGYGLHRRWQTPRMLTAGPRILLVQPNFPQTNSGAKGASQQQMIDFHINATARAIQKYGNVDLACWSETMMPALNEAYRTAIEEFVPSVAMETNEWFEQVSHLASRDQVNIITGGLFHARPRIESDRLIFDDRRNSAFLFRTSGRLDLAHYDKIHLVPFGEYMPFRDSAWLGWLHNLLMRLSPYDYDYTLTTPGSVENPAVFRLNIKGNPTTRILTPICFEDIDASLCAALMRGPGGKRADLLVNLTNDGWFRGGENAQHLQAALFRSIENRVPIARSVNTGISAFIDSYGRVTETVAVRTEGVAVQQVMLDSRYTLYTRVGDLFAWLCTLITLLLVGFGLVDRWGGRHP